MRFLFSLCGNQWMDSLSVSSSVPSSETYSTSHPSSSPRTCNFHLQKRAPISPRVYRTSSYLLVLSFRLAHATNICRYLLGSGGTLMFDVTIVSQFALYRRKASPRERGRRTSVSRHIAEEEGLLGEDVEEGTTTPQRRRHPVEDRTYTED